MRTATVSRRTIGDWIKVKNVAHPAIERAMQIALSKRGGKRASL